MGELITSSPESLTPKLTPVPVARYRLTFRARDDIALPEYAGSLLRGQFGSALRRTVCVTGENKCPSCALYRSCVYPAIYETPAPEHHALQKFSAVPNPYVIEPPPTGMPGAHRGEALSFNVVLFGRALAQLALVVFAFDRAFTQGIGRQRSQATLEQIEWQTDGNWRSVWDADERRLHEHDPALSMPTFAATDSLTLAIHTPLRLQHQGQPLRVKQVTPRALLTTLLRRVSLLFDLHTDRRDVIGDPHALAEHAQTLTDTRDLRWCDWTRYSSRQRQEMTLGGVIGRWTLHGDLVPFLPWLWLGQWLHVGKNAVMGMGGYRLEPDIGVAE